MKNLIYIFVVIFFQVTPAWSANEKFITIFKGDIPYGQTASGTVALSRRVDVSGWGPVCYPDFFQMSKGIEEGGAGGEMYLSIEYSSLCSAGVGNVDQCPFTLRSKEQKDWYCTYIVTVPSGETDGLEWRFDSFLLRGKASAGGQNWPTQIDFKQVAPGSQPVVTVPIVRSALNVTAVVRCDNTMKLRWTGGGRELSEPTKIDFDRVSVEWLNADKPGDYQGQCISTFTYE